MIPILYEENSTSFTSNGIGRLSDAIKCIVTEERNGQYELALEYPVTGAHYEDIGIRKIIVVRPSINADLQPFRIYKITKPIAGRVGIYAQHISYDLSKNVVMPFSIPASSAACAQTLAGLKQNAVEPCPFNFSTDVTRIAPYNQSTPMSMRARLGGSEGSVLDQFHGEYEFDVYDVILHSSRGHDRNVSLRYGKNIVDLTQEENITNTVTGVVPYWSNMDGTETVTLPEKVVYSQYADRYSQKLTVPLDLSGNYEEQPTVETLRAAAQAYVSSSSLGIPEISIKVSFVNLRDTVEYEDIADLETVSLCDTVHVQFEPLGIDATAEVVKCVWDVLLERYNEISVGSVGSSFTATLNKQNSSTVSAIEKTKVQAGTAINKATAWLSSGDGYIVAIKGEDGEWKELLAMDTNDIETAVKVMRLNENGLGGSSHGIDGPYNAAILVDGTIVADAVKTGILTDLNDKFYLNMETGELVMKDGTFTGLIKGSVIRFGDDTGDNYATMDWRTVLGVVDTLAITANGGRPIQIESQTSSSVYSRLYLSSGTGGIAAKNTASISAPVITLDGEVTIEPSDGVGGNLLTRGNIGATGNIVADGRVYSQGHYVPYSFTDGLNLATFESNGKKYLGVYHGSTNYGFVELASS